VLTALLLGACTVGPNYQRPAVPAPPTFRGQAEGGPTESLGDLSWWQVFQDETLQALLREAVRENYDVRLAVARILDARAQLIIARSFQFPRGQPLEQRELSAHRG
jgi:outer membrane protein, multidrug efflux system